MMYIKYFIIEATTKTVCAMAYIDAFYINNSHSLYVAIQTSLCIDTHKCLV